MNQTIANNTDTLLGRLVVEKGLATAQDVQDCLAKRGGSEQDHAEDPSQLSLAQVMIEQGVVTPRQIERLRPEVEEQKAGRQIPGYQMLSKLGAGAMATVYKAKQLSLDRMVAIKVLPRASSEDPKFVKRFYDEGRAAAKLNHPNIVGALDVGQAGEYHYFVMEYVQGRTVYEDIVKKGRYSEQEVLEIGVQIARALKHAHEAGFIHRDVKPKNIMITPEGVAKLADMGLARAATDREAAESEQGKAYGTPYYISPEQIRGQMDVDFRADIYSLGATLYHMVTGQVPFEGPNPSAVMHRHLKSELTPPDQINTDLSAGFGEIIEVCMAKKRDKRYATTADLLSDLEAVSRGDVPTQARRKFDLSALSSLQPDTDDDADGTSGMVVVDAGTPLTSQPVFWVAVGGWALAAVLLIGLVLALINA